MLNLLFNTLLTITPHNTKKRRRRRKERTTYGQCPDYAHMRASSVFSAKDNRTVTLTRQDFLPDPTTDADLLFGRGPNRVMETACFDAKVQ